MTYCITFLGAPGSGKGTQAEKLSQELGIKKFSIGDIIRDEVVKNTELGNKVQPYIEAGNLVPDNLIIDIFKDKANSVSNEKGFISDGFPRNKDQAEALDNIINHNDIKVLMLEVKLEDVKERLLGRQVCGSCKSIYHKINSPSKIKNICDSCGSELKTRKDDTPEIIENRFKVYMDSITPLINYFEGRIIKINAAQSSDEVFKSILENIEWLQ